jgi:hypothetical protein
MNITTFQILVVKNKKIKKKRNQKELIELYKKYRIKKRKNNQKNIQGKRNNIIDQ